MRSDAFLRSTRRSTWRSPKQHNTVPLAIDLHQPLTHDDLTSKPSTSWVFFLTLLPVIEAPICHRLSWHSQVSHPHCWKKINTWELEELHPVASGEPSKVTSQKPRTSAHWRQNPGPCPRQHRVAGIASWDFPRKQSSCHCELCPPKPHWGAACYRSSESTLNLNVVWADKVKKYPQLSTSAMQQPAVGRHFQEHRLHWQENQLSCRFCAERIPTIHMVPMGPYGW